MEPTGPNLALRLAIENGGYQFNEMAEAESIPPPTLRSWVAGRTPLRANNRMHRDAVKRICARLKIDEDTIWAAKNVVAEMRRPYAPAGLHLAEILLDTLEDPHASKQKKSAARLTLLEWLKDILG